MQHLRLDDPSWVVKDCDAWVGWKWMLLGTNRVPFVEIVNIQGTFVASVRSEIRIFSDVITHEGGACALSVMKCVRQKTDN